MNNWTLEKIKKQVKFGDFVSIDGDDFNKRVFDEALKDRFFTHRKSLSLRGQWDRNNLDVIDFRFFDRQGNEILPEPEYKYVNFDSFGELCEAIINGVGIFRSNGERFVYVPFADETLANIYVQRNTFFKRVGV